MRETPDAGRKRIDLSVPQVAGSALAAVVAAKLASYFGVYGTILGAGVVSVVASCGGTLFQHFFRRTGEQLREGKPPVRPRQVGTPAPDGFGEGTVYRARTRTWRRPVVAAAVVFAVTMAGITTYELVSGSSFSGGRGTTVSGAVGDRGRSVPGTGGTGPGARTSAPAADPSARSSSSGASEGTAGSAGSAGSTASPSGAPSAGGAAGPGATPAPTGSASPRPSGDPAPAPGGSTAATPPGPSASSRSGTGVPGPAGPAAP
ncbi:hypothetical protein [Streptomyces collinus]|uniref:hypothetical protein n=1 Tax=Streptomyces collinus TaxID=42684 RepID=UPI00294225EB|nr:hypothetical protein [Streptomyces collinus]